MSKALIKHPGASVNTGNYSPGLVCDGWLYISGQGSIDLASGKVVGTTIEEQTRQTLRNVQSILNAAGCTMDDVVQCTCYLADMGDWPIFNEVYAEFFSGILPTRTTVGAALGDILVEISAVAKIPKAKPAQSFSQTTHKKGEAMIGDAESSSSAPVVGVAGLGLLGRGIAACLLGRGFRVIAYTHREEEFVHALRHIEVSIRELVDRAGFPTSLLTQWRQRYQPVESLSELHPCTFVIESVVEDLAIKRTVFDAIEQAVGRNIPIASNTSALPISILQTDRRQPHRFVGMHWSEPAHVTRFLEIIRGNQTDDATTNAAIALGIAAGKEPSLVQKDVPGFITNRLMYAVIREALHLLESGVGDVETIDRSFRNDIGWWATIAGPFRWMDLTGLPAYAAVAENLFRSLSNATDVPALLRQLAASGAQGTANGRGFYNYDQNTARHWEEVWAQFTWDIRQLAQKYTPLKNPSSGAPPAQP